MGPSPQSVENVNVQAAPVSKIRSNIEIYLHLCLIFIVIFINLQVCSKNFTTHCKTCFMMSRSLEMTLSRELARQNDGPQIMTNSYFVTGCCVANWTKPRAWFCGLGLGLAGVFTQNFRYLSRRGKESYHVILSGQSDSMTNGPSCRNVLQIPMNVFWSLFWCSA